MPWNSGRAAHARWQLNGVDPRQVSLIVLAQVPGGLFSAVGAGLGLLLTTVMAEPLLIHSGIRERLGRISKRPPSSVGPLTAGAGVGAVVLPLALLGGIAAARRAGRTPALEALRESEPRLGIRMRWWRWLWFALVLPAGAVAAIEAWMRSPAANRHRRGPGIADLADPADRTAAHDRDRGGRAGAVSARAARPDRAPARRGPPRPGSSPGIRRAITSPAPRPRSHHCSPAPRCWAASTPSPRSGPVKGARAAGERFQGPQLAQIILLLGGPVLLAAPVGAAVVVFMSNRVQGNEQALLSASGASVVG